MEGLGPLAQYGLAGIVLWWFMFRNEAAMRRQASEIARMADAVLLVVLASPVAPATVKAQARYLLDRGKSEEEEAEVSDAVPGVVRGGGGGDRGGRALRTGGKAEAA